MKKMIIILALMVSGQSYAWVYDKENFDFLGKPKNLVQTPAFSSNFYNDIVKVLPERKNTVYTHPDYFTTSNSSVDLGEKAEDVKVTFLHEGAGFKNSFGYVTYTGVNPPDIEFIKENGILIFPNTSLKGSGGNLSYGDTYSLGSFPKGTRLLFFILSNAWQNRNIKDTDWLFTTDLKQNPESGSMNFISLKQHVAMLWHEESEVIVLGFEDVLRTETWCDHDFNDVMFTVSSSPSSAIDFQKYNIVPDPETINDNLTYYNGILAYEDLWPLVGDFDFNDVVMYYSISETKDNGLVTGINYHMTPQAMGASYSNSFRLKIRTAPGNIKTITKSFGGKNYELIKDGTIVNERFVYEDSEGTVIEIMDNVKGFIPPPESYNMSNTIKNSPIVSGIKTSINISFYNGISSDILGVPPYDSFISRQDEYGRIVEVHLMEFPPTGSADLSYFGTADDGSDFDAGVYYRTSDKKPWVILIPGSWNNPLEQTRIDLPYSSMLDWVRSGGVNNKDWYYKNIKPEYIFKRNND